MQWRECRVFGKSTLPTPYAGSMTNILCYYLSLNQHGERMYLALDPRGRELGVEAFFNLHCSPWGKPLFFGTELNLKVCQVRKGLRNVADVGAEDFKWNNDGHFREQNAEGTCGQVELFWGIECSNGQVGQVVQQKTSLSCSSHHRNQVFNVFLSNFGSAWH